MTEPFRILVVCDTNVFRSPLAERSLRFQFDSLLGTAADDIEVSSAGVRAVVGSPMDAHAAAELERVGGTSAWFEARQLTPTMMREADLILTATRALRSLVLEDEPTALKRTFTLGEFAALSELMPYAGSPRRFVAQAAACRWAAGTNGCDLADPAGGSRRRHREVASSIGDASKAIVATWARMLALSA